MISPTSRQVILYLSQSLQTLFLKNRLERNSMICCPKQGEENQQTASDPQQSAIGYHPTVFYYRR
eukprot:1542529-Amphidinium_carterae.1